VVEVDQLQLRPSVVPVSHKGNADPRVTKAYLARFIEDWRDVTVDREAQQAAIARLYAMLPRNSVALQKLNEHFAVNNPYVLGVQESVNITVTDLLTISDHSWQVECAARCAVRCG
jgi:type IV secretion system protein VirB5